MNKDLKNEIFNIFQDLKFSGHWHLTNFKGDESIKTYLDEAHELKIKLIKLLNESSEQ